MTMTIDAEVIDITSDTPLPSDVFFVDSNVWFWVGYSNASVSSRYNQSTDYPVYLNSALSAGSHLLKCTLSFSEIAHSIERSECEIFNRVNGSNIKPKRFRHDYPSARQNVVTEITNAWALADSITSGQSVEVNVNNAAVSAAINRIESQSLDGYDLFMLDAILDRGIKSVLTDDSDFGQVPGIRVFTANRRLIQDAGSQGKLVKR